MISTSHNSIGMSSNRTKSIDIIDLSIDDEDNDRSSGLEMKRISAPLDNETVDKKSEQTARLPICIQISNNPTNQIKVKIF